VRGVVKMKATKKIVQDGEAIIRLYLFLKHEIGLKDELCYRDLKALLMALKQPK